METLKKIVEKLAEEGLYSYSTIKSFGWGSHLNRSKGGVVVELKRGENVVVYPNDNGKTFVIPYADSLDDSEIEDVNNLMNWILS